MRSSEWLFGLHAVGAALREHPERVLELHVDGDRRDRRLGELVALAETQGIALQRVDGERLARRVPGQRTQGVLARYRPAPARDESTLTELLAHAAEPALLLVLDEVTDPHNLGACLRTAEAAGAHAAIAPRGGAASLTPSVRKVAAGAAERVPYVQVTNLARTLEWLKARGVWVIGAAGRSEISLYACELTAPLALVLGAEASGLRRLTRERCDRLASLPMSGQAESLNVSVAAGVCLFEALRQRRSR